MAANYVLSARMWKVKSEIRERSNYGKVFSTSVIRKEKKKDFKCMLIKQMSMLERRNAAFIVYLVGVRVLFTRLIKSTYQILLQQSHLGLKKKKKNNFCMNLYNTMQLVLQDSKYLHPKIIALKKNSGMIFPHFLFFPPQSKIICFIAAMWTFQREMFPPRALNHSFAPPAAALSLYLQETTFKEMKLEMSKLDLKAF